MSCRLVTLKIRLMICCCFFFIGLVVNSPWCTKFCQVFRCFFLKGVFLSLFNPLLSVIPCLFCYFLSFLSITFPPLHSSSLVLLYCFECLEGCAFARGPKSSFLLELGPSLWGWGAGGGDGLVDVASHKLWILTGMGRSRVHTPNEVAAPQPLSWHSDSPALILIQPSAFSTGCHCWPA